MTTVQELRDQILPKIAEPFSDEGQEEIHEEGRTHVSEIWEDGEITVTKCGDLYRSRRLHQVVPPVLPEGKELFEVPDGQEHKRMVIVDDEVKDIIEEYHEEQFGYAPR